MEDKAKFCEELFPILKEQCRQLNTLERLEYDAGQDVIFAYFKRGIRVIHVEGDSCYGILGDIYNQILS